MIFYFRFNISAKVFVLKKYITINCQIYIIFILLYIEMQVLLLFSIKKKINLKYLV